MSGGRPRKPTGLHIVHGTFRKDRANQDEPKPELISEVPRPPSHLNAAAKRKWKELAPVLVNSKLLSVLDLTALEMLCDSYGVFREAHDAIFHPVHPRTGKRFRRTLGQYLAGQNSQTTPELSAMNKARDAYKAFMTEFGLSPATRTKVSPLSDTGQNSEMDDLLDEESI